MNVRIGNKTIGGGNPVYVIAEIGSNHDDDLTQATRLIEAAADAGANACKFQLYRADQLYPGTVTPHAIPDWWLTYLQGVCQDHHVDFLCSVFSQETLDAYLDINPPAVKIASPEATNRPLLEQAANTGLPLIVSTGAMGWNDLDHTAWTLDGTETILLHCTSAYPAPDDQLNLQAIPRMINELGLPVGLSDHSLGTTAPIAAATLGACIIEKHLTLDRGMDGPDHHFALEPDEFRQMVAALRRIPAMLGNGDKRVMPAEDPADRRTIPA